MKQVPIIPLHDPRFNYLPAATHTCSQGFRQRQELRRLLAQRKLLERKQ